MWERIKLMMSSVWSFLLPFLKIFLSKIGPILADAAMQAVAALATSDMSGSDKRDAAFKQIENTLKSKGIEVGASVINSAIEAAVQNLKASGS